MDVAVAGQDGAVPGQDVVAVQVRDAPASFGDDERDRRDVLLAHGQATDDQRVAQAGGHVQHALGARQEDLPVQPHEQFLRPGGRVDHLHPRAARVPGAAHGDALRRAVVHLMPAAQAAARVDQVCLLGS